MQLHQILAAGVSSIFSYSSLSSGRPPSGGIDEKELTLRQAPAVIATSDFLRRGFHTSCKVGNWLYIDGGEFSFLDNGNPSYQYSSTLLSIDLSQDWTNATFQIQSNTKPNGVPNLNNPSLWYHSQEGVIYSGFTGWASPFGDQPSLPSLSLWTFKPDQSGSGAWSEVIDSSNTSVWNPLTRPSSALMAYDAESAWIRGGYVRPSGYDLTTQQVPLSGMVRFDMGALSFSNSSVSENLNETVESGNMHFVHSFGPKGLFVVMGGTTSAAASGLISFDTVTIFDPAKQEWLTQATTGNTPTPRIEFCTAGLNSTNGTYELFVYAGWGTNLGSASIQYDTISILTLPAFHWISVPYNPSDPRHGHTCNAVGGSQILSIGGVDSNPQITTGNTATITQSTFNSPDPFAQGLAIFDMTTLAWSNQYFANPPPYVQSDPVQQFYAQSQHDYLQNLNQGVAALVNSTHITNNTTPASPPPQSASQPTPTNTNTNTTSSLPTSPPSSLPTHKPPPAAIAGAITSSLISLFLLTSLTLYLLRRHRNRQRNALRTNSTDSSALHGPFKQQYAYGLHEMPCEVLVSELPQPGTGAWELKEEGVCEIGDRGEGMQPVELESPIFGVGGGVMGGRGRGKVEGWSNFF